jgi:hypothetical protein
MASWNLAGLSACRLWLLRPHVILEEIHGFFAPATQRAVQFLYRDYGPGNTGAFPTPDSQCLATHVGHVTHPVAAAGKKSPDALAVQVGKVYCCAVDGVDV